MFEDSIKNWVFIAGVLIINTAIVVVCYYIGRFTGTRALARSQKNQPEPQEVELREETSLADEWQFGELREDKLEEDELLPPESTDND